MSLQDKLWAQISKVKMYSLLAPDPAIAIVGTQLTLFPVRLPLKYIQENTLNVSLSTLCVCGCVCARVFVLQTPIVVLMLFYQSFASMNIVIPAYVHTECVYHGSIVVYIVCIPINIDIGRGSSRHFRHTSPKSVSGTLFGSTLTWSRFSSHAHLMRLQAIRANGTQAISEPDIHELFAKSITNTMHAVCRYDHL